MAETTAPVAALEQTSTPEQVVKTKGKVVSKMLDCYEKMDLTLRGVAVAATLSAAVVMATNHQTKFLPVGPLLNNRPMVVPLEAKYNYTPAFVFFVVMNAVAGGYALVSLISFGSLKVLRKAQRSDFHKSVTAFLDLVVVGGLTAGASAATAISDLGKRGNVHSRWMKICDKYETFCNHGGGALLASFAGVAVFMLLNVLAVVSIYRSARSLRAQAVTV